MLSIMCCAARSCRVGRGRGGPELEAPTPRRGCMRANSVAATPRRAHARVPTAVYTVRAELPSWRAPGGRTQCARSDRGWMQREVVPTHAKSRAPRSAPARESPRTPAARAARIVRQLLAATCQRAAARCDSPKSDATRSRPSGGHGHHFFATERSASYRGPARHELLEAPFILERVQSARSLTSRPPTWPSAVQVLRAIPCWRSSPSTERPASVPQIAMICSLKRRSHRTSVVSTRESP
jgi:hypothetical protein